MLYIVGTPIGNIEDMTHRAVRVLGEVDLILSEDTRKTGLLLKHYGIATQQKSYRVHNLEYDTQFAVARLREGLQIALVTDAGTPGVSDPGSYLVRTVRRELPETRIVPIPGPSALASALSVSGFQTNPSLFGGFLSSKGSRRRRFLEENREFEGCIVLYESVHRVESLLEEIRAILPDREVFVAREMTKIYEEYVAFPPETPVKLPTVKGEFTIVIGPPERHKSTDAGQS
ncbi:MAG: 16S rRNA (cytidine(1402)-2'-O)-methyltransferase, partial [Spirochaetia bacterium]|nr:16S rRNA (cytidine(1402)-2'-O)-methyltransferase [Spirochaetia bacterium]